jgi:hypothetical protein
MVTILLVIVLFMGAIIGTFVTSILFALWEANVTDWHDSNSNFDAPFDEFLH